MKELRVTSANVKPNCRKIHGIKEAGEIALNHLRKAYKRAIMAECNKEAEFEFILCLKRKD
jgi:hypothetical protein